MEIEAVVFLMHRSKYEMNDKRLTFAKTTPCKTCGMSDEPEDILNVVGSDSVIERNDSAHSPTERCQVVKYAEETVARATELNNGEAERLLTMLQLNKDDISYLRMHL